MKYLLTLITVLFPTSALGQIEWGSSFEAARKMSAQTKKPILVDFMASWCGPCRKMDEETLPDPRVKALLQKVVLVRLDVDKNPPQAKQYGVSSIPRLIMLPSGGGEPLMDVMGFREADTLLQELRPALGLPPDIGPAPPAVNTDYLKVRQALESNQYAALKAADPKTAAAGLDRVVEKLGVTKEADFAPIAALVRKAGEDAVPALIRGLINPVLAVRAGAYRALQESLKSGPPPPSFDPWASVRDRKVMVGRWVAWWGKRKGLAG